MTNIHNIILIDETLIDVDLFVNSVNSSTLPIIYSSATTKQDILNQLTTITNIDRIGIVFSFNYNTFLENSPFFDTFTEPYNTNMDFIISIIQQFNVKHIDYLACNTLNDSAWVNYYNILSQITGVIVGASNDLTGNIKYGGDWVMESTSEDIEFIYFTESIGYYRYLLDTSLFTIVMKKESTLYKLYGTGYNLSGQLGLGNTTTPITQLSNITIPAGLIVKYIAGGNYHIIILMTNGDLYSTGLNSEGQLGLGNTTNPITSLTLIPNTTGLIPTSISCGFRHTVVLMTTGEIYGMGRNGDGQLGLGNTTTPKNSLTLIPNTTGLVPKSISCGASHTIVLMNTGELYGTGYNLTGQLGLGNTTNPITSLTLIPNTTGLTPISVTSGAYHVVYLMNDGSMYGTGRNSEGPLGLNNRLNVVSSLTLIPNSTTKTPKYIACGALHTIVLMTDGSLYCTGYNAFGQLGLGNTTTPVIILTVIPLTGIVPQYISCGYSHTNVLMSNGVLYGTGINTDGQLGLGNTSSPITTLTPFLNGENIVYLINNTDIMNLVVCFNEDSLILTDKGYLPIQDLRKGDLVKTLNGFIPIFMISKREIYHYPSNNRISNQLYVCSTNYPEVFKPLVITGCHSILIEEFSSEEEKERMMKVLGRVCITENKYRLPVCADERSEIYDVPGRYTIYHLALENDDYYMNYGIFANGLLVESCSKRYLKELSNMEIVQSK